MGRIVTKNQPCDDCGGSDPLQVYEDGSTFCFSCRKSRPAPKQPREVIDMDFEVDDGATSWGDSRLNEIKNDYPVRGFKERNIYKQVAEHYGVKVSYDLDGAIESHYYPYYENEQLTGYKVRNLPKNFSSVGKVRGGLFGQNLYSGGKRLVITEGECDAMAVQSAWYKRYKTFYPVVSIRSASSLNDLIEERDWVRNFDEVILWFDGDTAGQEATKEAARIIGYDKVKIAKGGTEKDANDLWIKDADKVLKVIYDAVDYTPAGILGKEELWTQLEEYNKLESIPYPPFMTGLNDKLKGMRFGEITLWTSGTGSGKSTLLREIAVHLLEATDDKIGIVSLEESPAETARKMSGMALNRNPAKEEIPLEELREGYDKIFGDDRVLVLDHQGSIADGSIMDYLEYMCLSGAKYLFVDHITILASEGADGLTGNEAIDKIMNDLLRLVKKHNVWIGLISHLRKTDNKGKSFEEGKLPSMDDIRGSGSIKQISMDIIAFARDVGSSDENKRNTIRTKVLKCRYTGLTGPSGALHYDFETGRLALGQDYDDDAEAPTNNGFQRV
jgi:twinkle protein